MLFIIILSFWSVREESRLRFENFRKGVLTVMKYETQFYQLSRHSLAIILDEAERTPRFVRVLSYSIHLKVFKSSREGSSFHSVVEAANEAELIECEEFVDMRDKRPRTSDLFSGASPGGNESLRRGGSFHHHGPIHAAI